MNKTLVKYTISKIPDESKRHVIQVMAPIDNRNLGKLNPVVMNLCMREWWQNYFREYCNTSISPEFLEIVNKKVRLTQLSDYAIPPIQIYGGENEDYPAQLLLSGIVVIPDIPDKSFLDPFAADEYKSRTEKFAQDGIDNWFDFYISTYEFLHLETMHYGNLKKGMTQRFRNILTRNFQKYHTAA